MDEYDTNKFKAVLNFLTMRTCFGTFNELPMTKVYEALMDTVNNGRGIRLYRYYKPTKRNIADIKKGVSIYPRHYNSMTYTIANQYLISHEFAQSWKSV